MLRQKSKTTSQRGSIRFALEGEIVTLDDVDPTRPLREQRVCLRPRAKPPGPEPRRCAAAVSECVPFLRELARGRRGHGKRKPGTRRDFAPPVCRGLSVAGAASSAAQ